MLHTQCGYIACYTGDIDVLFVTHMMQMFCVLHNAVAVLFATLIMWMFCLLHT